MFRSTVETVADVRYFLCAQRRDKRDLYYTYPKQQRSDDCTSQIGTSEKIEPGALLVSSIASLYRVIDGENFSVRGTILYQSLWAEAVQLVEGIIPFSVGNKPSW